MNKHLSDRAIEDYQLVRKAVDENDQAAYAELMARYRDAVYHTMFKMVRNRDDAEDLTIEAFAKAFNKLDGYAPTFAFSTWLFKIATNNCIDFIRRQRMKIYSIEEAADNGLHQEKDLSESLRTDALDPEERYIREQRQHILREVLQRLSEKYRQMIELRYFEELSYQEIAERLELPLGTVKAQLFRAKDMLYEILKNSDKGGGLF